jgi:hypothetical protein
MPIGSGGEREVKKKAARGGDADDLELALFKKYSIALRLWARKFNTAEIAAYLREPEHIVCRWIWHWRELSRT